MAQKSLSTRFFSKKAGNPFALSLAWVFIIQGIHTLRYLQGMPLPPYLLKGGHHQFLTNISYVITWVYFISSALYHLVGGNYLGHIKEYLSAIALSAEFIVVSVYWSMRLFVPTLIVQKGQIVPLDLDLLIHVMPFASLVIDYFFFCERWNIGASTGLAVMLGFAFAYWKWLEHLIGLDGVYPYPFLNVPVPQRAVIFAVVGLCAYGAFLLFKYIHPASKKSSHVHKKIN